MTVEEMSSQKVEVLTDAEVEALKLNELELGKIIRLAEHEYHHVILVDDANGDRFWFPFDGSDIEGALRCNRLYKNGQKLFQEKSFDQQDVARLREVLLAVSVLCNFFENTEEEVASLYDNVCVRFAYDLYKKDHVDFVGTIDDLKDNEDFHTYIQMVTVMTKNYFDLLNEVKASVAQSKDDIEHLKEKGQL